MFALAPYFKVASMYYIPYYRQLPSRSVKDVHHAKKVKNIKMVNKLKMLNIIVFKSCCMSIV